jgi:hypothetical protein
MLSDETLPPKSMGMGPWLFRRNAERILSLELSLHPGMFFSLMGGMFADPV